MWCSSQAPQLMKQFGRVHQGSKADGLSLNLMYDSLELVSLCKSSYMVFGPYLLCSFYGRFFCTPVGTMAVEAVFWGEYFSVYGK